MVFKDNIIPYSFKVRSYTKIVTNILIYNGWYADSVTNRHEEKFSVDSYETDQMDTIYQCYNAVKMTKDGLTRVYVDRDGVNITVNLKPTGGLANGVRRYASQTGPRPPPPRCSLPPRVSKPAFLSESASSPATATCSASPRTSSVPRLARGRITRRAC